MTHPDATALLDWYDRHRRDLPWRAAPGTRADPYRVWLSEIMLQQTTVAAVKDYFARFTARWPTVAGLAGAGLDDVLAEWAGLGYYARARNLHACARVVANDCGGRFPDTEAELVRLPGIGAYTAGAIAAIAFNRRAVAMDGNAERVMARMLALETPLPRARRELRRAAEDLVPGDRPGDFAQALMDLGATVCAPRRADCQACPLARACAGRRRGIQDSLPRKPVKTARPTRRGVAFWVARTDGTVLLRRRPDKGLLGGMMEVPSTPWTEAGPADPLAHAPCEARWRPLPGRVAHTFTHFHLELAVWTATIAPGTPLLADEDGRWVEIGALGGEALPSVMKKIAAAGLGRPVRARG